VGGSFPEHEAPIGSCIDLDDIALGVPALQQRQRDLVGQQDYLVLRERDVRAVASKHTESNTGLYL